MYLSWKNKTCYRPDNVIYKDGEAYWKPYGSSGKKGLFIIDIVKVNWSERCASNCISELSFMKYENINTKFWLDLRSRSERYIKGTKTVVMFKWAIL